MGLTARALEAATVAHLQARERLSLGRPDGARSWAEDRHEKDRACHECQARQAKVHVSSHVLIGERGHTRANKRRLFLLRRRKRCQSEP